MFSACVAEPVDDSFWIFTHNKQVELAQSKDVNVAFIGASIIEYMADTKIWKEKIEKFNCINFGIAGDRVENVLYRLENGLLDNMKTKIVVLMVGSNNVFEPNDDVDDISNGIIEIVKRMRVKQPESTIIVLGIPPKGKEHNFTRNLLEKLNKLIEEKINQLSDNHVKYLCCHNGFVNPNDGTLGDEYTLDELHLSDHGYSKYCQPIIECIESVLK